MGKDIYIEILDHFSDERTKKDKLKITHSYDLTIDESYVLIEQDSQQAANAARDLDLNFTVDAKHYAKTENGVEETNTVMVVWEFWK